MKVIDSYLATMFANYPKTPPFIQARQDLHRMMEEQVDDLMSEGLTETQALGKVISEFGSLEEVAEDVHLDEEIAAHSAHQANPHSLKPELSLERVKTYSNIVHNQAPRRATGTSLYILAPAALMFCMAIGRLGTSKANTTNVGSAAEASSSFEPIMLVVGLALLLVLVALGVIVRRSAEAPLRKFVDIETEDYSLAPPTISWLKQQTAQQKVQDNFLRSIAIGLFIVSAAAVIIPGALDASEPFVLLGVGVFLVLVAAGVWLLIFKGSATKAEEDLLLNVDEEEDDFFDVSDSSSPVIRVLGAVYWPLLLVVFFIWGFVFDGWDRNWVLFPIGGVAYWGLSEVAEAYEKNLR